MCLALQGLSVVERYSAGLQVAYDALGKSEKFQILKDREETAEGDGGARISRENILVAHA